MKAGSLKDFFVACALTFMISVVLITTTNPNSTLSFWNLCGMVAIHFLKERGCVCVTGNWYAAVAVAVGTQARVSNSIGGSNSISMVSRMGLIIAKGDSVLNQLLLLVIYLNSFFFCRLRSRLLPRSSTQACFVTHTSTNKQQQK
jgi:hypothetical protein